MMTQSDHVATNALVRTVGGTDHVNEVARSLGAENTLLYQKLSSERAAIPQLDNTSTPRDMAAMMQQIADGEAASEKSCRHMIGLMDLNELDWWLDAGLPAVWIIAACFVGTPDIGYAHLEHSMAISRQNDRSQ
jgi:beta-lactamase class A